MSTKAVLIIHSSPKRKSDSLSIMHSAAEEKAL